ncbi:MAG: SAM-dependent methyltransferase, partial [Chloroflexales bacterium]|nr:SAM-dependent methyltransferase [Chloroflexales bacterium]
LTGCEADGITLSSELLAHARALVEQRGLEHRVRFDFADYRRHAGHYSDVVTR